MKLHIVSDIHLEFYKDVNTLNDLMGTYPSLNKNVDTSEYGLILAGDIGYPTCSNYQNFVKDCCSKYRFVIIICGNHEYYNSSIEYINEYLESFSKDIDNLHFLNENKVIIDDYVFLGCTFWTFVDKYSKQTVKCNMNDYNMIKYKDKFLTVDDTNEIHEKQNQWLINELKSNDSKKNIVITHHLPTNQLIHEKFVKYGSINKAFYSNCDYMFYSDEYSIDYWICGHSHEKMDIDINKTRIILNPLGYKKEVKKDVSFEELEI